MKIQILNKNNNQFYEVDEAPIFTECYNETLDTGTVIISNQENEIKIEPYDIIAIYKNNNDFWKYMCVDTYTRVMSSVKPKIYRYEITLFSETKQLEGIILPNLKITKLWNIRRNIYNYINQYMSEYCPKIRVSSTSSWSGNIDYKWKWTEALDDEHELLSNKFSDECPEMQWNTPTLREVLNDLMMVKDCIPIIKNGILSYMDLTQTKDDVSEDTHINSITTSKSSEDYVSELQVNLVNVTNNIENVNNFVTLTEYKTFSVQDNEVILTDSNLFLRTDYPIYKLKKLIMCFTARGDTATDGVIEWVEFDLCSIQGLVSEYQEWVTKYITYNTAAPNNLVQFADSQTWSLYYKRNTREIGNFSSKAKFFFLSDFLIEELPDRIVKYLYPQVTRVIKPKYYQLLFKVEYETLEGCLFRASKNDNVEHDRIVIDNQTNSYADSYNQGFLEYQKANRLGNEQLQINARYLPTDALMQIGDVYEDSVIYQCQYQYFKNHVEVNALATKNYILREYFTGVKSKIRSWAVVTGSEALVRHDLQKFYCEFSYSQHQDLFDSSVSLRYYDSYICEYLISPLKQYPTSPLKTCFVRSYIGGAWRPPVLTSVNYYCLNLINRLIGNSLVFTFKFLDNYWVGQSFDEYYVNISNMNSFGELTTSAYIEGGLPIEQNVYTTPDGECESLEIIYGDGVKVIPGSTVNDIVVGERPTSDQIKLTESNSYQRPKINIDSLYGIGYEYRKVGLTTIHRKDSQEILNQSTQFEFSTDTTNICFSKKWLERQQAVASDDNNPTLKIRAYDKSLYNFRNPNELPDGSYTEYNVTLKTFTTNNLTAKIEVHITSISNPVESIAENTLNNLLNNKCVYLMNNDDEILVVFNNVPNNNRKIADPETLGGAYVPYFDFYLNVLRSRNKNIYDSANRYLIIGKI